MDAPPDGAVTDVSAAQTELQSFLTELLRVGDGVTDVQKELRRVVNVMSAVGQDERQLFDRIQDTKAETDRARASAAESRVRVAPSLLHAFVA